MSIRILDRVFKASRSKNGARLVLLALADYADDNGRAYPSRSGIARKANLSERPVDHALQWLVKSGELQIQLSAGPKGCNVYNVLLPPVESAPPVNSTPPVESAETPRQIDGLPPVKSAPEPSGTVKEPSDNKKNARASLDECRAFAEQHGLPTSDGEAFFHGKEGNGWKNGSNPIKNWRSTFLNWKARGFHPSQASGQHRGKGTLKVNNPGGSGKDTWNKPAGRNDNLNAGTSGQYAGNVLVDMT